MLIQQYSFGAQLSKMAALQLSIIIFTTCFIKGTKSLVFPEKSHHGSRPGLCPGSISKGKSVCIFIRIKNGEKMSTFCKANGRAYFGFSLF